MAAPASPPVTSVTSTLTALAAFILADPTSGVYVYTDSGQAPTGAGVAASTFGTNAAMLAYYEALAAVIAAIKTTNAIGGTWDADAAVLAHFEGLAAVQTDLNSVTNAWRTIARGSINVYNNTDGAAAHVASVVANGTVLFVNKIFIPTDLNLWCQIATGSLSGDYAKYEDLIFQSLS